MSLRIFPFLFAGLLACGLPAKAQKAAPAGKHDKKYLYGHAELNIEGGLTLPFTPNFVVNSTVITPGKRNVGVGSELLLKYLFPGYSKVRLGLRAGMSILRVAKDAAVSYTNNPSGGYEEVPVKYANPLLQIGLQAHYDARLAPRVALRISPFAGYGYAWSNKIERSTTQVTALPIGNSGGFNAGADLTVVVKAAPNIHVTVSSGYQHSWMRMTNIENAGFNISHVPVGAGVSVLF